jgi:DNA-binding MarR family transcriptional regulator
MTTASVERHRAEAVQGLFDGLLHVSRSLRARSGDWGHAVGGLSRGDIATLGVVERGDGIRPGRIAQTQGVDPSVVSRQLATLDRLGLISRGTDPMDGRAELIGITHLGREQLIAARSSMCDALARRLTGWEPEEIARAASVIEDLADLLQDTPHDTEVTTIHEDRKESHV